jgi:hypothetical protein
MSDWEFGKRVLVFSVIMAIGLAIASAVPPFFALLIWAAAAIFGIRVLATGKIKG